MPSINPSELARELFAARERGVPILVPLSSRIPDFDLNAAYAVDAELIESRRASGRRVAGRKIGFANRALWRKFGLTTLAWGTMYDDTVHQATGNVATFSLEKLIAPKIEPEIVFRLQRSPAPDDPDPVSVLGAVEAMALGYEIIDCPFPGWQFKPTDFVAAFGFHAGLVFGEWKRLDPGQLAALAERLAGFTLKLLKDGQPAEAGGGSNVLGSPALCLGELASAIARQSGVTPLAAGELVSTGTLTTPQLIHPGEEWRAEVAGIDLPPLTLSTV
jgi:2-oxo-3-hexenedioate decarboxylase